MSGKLHHNEFDITDSLAQTLIKKQCPQYAHHPIHRLSHQGSDNILFKLGDDMVVRLPRTKTSTENLSKEAQFLPLIGKGVSLGVPAPLFRGKPSEDYPGHWLIMGWLPGQMLQENVLDTTKAAQALGNFIVELRQVSTLGAPAADRGHCLSFRDEQTLAAIEGLGLDFDKKRLREHWRRLSATPSWSGRPLWVHGDIHRGNVLTKGDEISAIVDFGMAGIGDPACDLMPAWTLLDSIARENFKVLACPDEESWQRGKGWALHFGIVAYCYYKERDQLLAHISYSTLRNVLADMH